MDDIGLVQTVLDLTGLGFLDSLADVGGDGAGLGGGHQTLGPEDLTETADGAHHFGVGDDGVELEPVLLLDLLNVLHAAGIVGACGEGFLDLFGRAEHEDADGLAGAVGQHDGAADLLVGVAAVDAELHVQLDGLVELGLAGVDDQLEGLLGIIQGLLIDELSALFIVFTSKQFCFLLKCGVMDG